MLKILHIPISFLWTKRWQSWSWRTVTAISTSYPGPATAHASKICLSSGGGAPWINYPVGARGSCPKTALKLGVYKCVLNVYGCEEPLPSFGGLRYI